MTLKQIERLAVKARKAAHKFHAAAIDVDAAIQTYHATRSNSSCRLRQIAEICPLLAYDVLSENLDAQEAVKKTGCS